MAHLARTVDIPPMVARFLYLRGLRSPEAAAAHLSPTLQSLSDPFRLADMEPAVDRLVRAVAAGEPVAVYGDYDADGVTATALVAGFLRNLGLPVRTYLPHRREEGYGLHLEPLRELAAAGVRLLVTVDCGIANPEEVAAAGELGMDVIVTDHHEPPPHLPRALAVINPKRPGCRFPFKHLAGVGVAFNLVRALRQRLHERGHWGGAPPPNLKAELDLVALGTLADVVPLLGDNRVLVRVGLEVLGATRRPGVRALMEVAGLSGTPTARDVAFRLVPRLNAAGRMDHAGAALDLLLAASAGEADPLARRLHELNQERQAEEAAILREALGLAAGQADRPALVLAGDGWNEGVVGIVASRLVDQLGKPVILLARRGGECRGSGRSPEGLDLFEALSRCAEGLTAFGGHTAAAGIRLPAAHLPAFTERFQAVVAATLEATGAAGRLVLDGPATVEELADPVFGRFFDLLAPFGPGYHEPLFLLRGFELQQKHVVGERHLKLRIGAPNPPGGALDLLAWGLGEKLSLPWDRMELACHACMNEWNGRRRLELRLKDARLPSTTDAA